MFLLGFVILWAAFSHVLAAAFLDPTPHLAGVVADAPPPQTAQRHLDRPTSQCRAICLSQTIEWPPSNEACRNNTDCFKCWKLCDDLANDELRYRSECQSPECGRGCEIACSFDFETSSVVSPPWELISPPTLLVIDEQNLKITWIPPKPQPATSEPYLVYTLLYYEDDNPAWSAIFSTVDTEATVTGYHRHLPGLAFRLMMTSANGTVAMVPVPYSKEMGLTSAAPMVIPEAVRTIPPWDPSLFLERVEGAKAYRPVGEELFPSKTKKSPGDIASLSVRLRRVEDGTLTSEISWEQTLEEDRDVIYVIGWGMITCNVDDTKPHCDIEDEQAFTEIVPRESSEMVVQLGDMLYNSKYWLDVSFAGFPATRLHFYTPPCHRIDRTFKRCHDRAAPTQGPMSGKDTSNKRSREPIPAKTQNKLEEDLVQLLREAGIKGTLPSDGALSVDTILAVVALGVGAVLFGLLCIAIYARLSKQNGLAKYRLNRRCQSLPGYLHNPGPGSLASLHRLNLHQAGSPLSQNLLLQSLSGSPYYNLPVSAQGPEGHYALQTTFGLLPPSMHKLNGASSHDPDSGMDDEIDMEQVPIISVDGYSDRYDKDTSSTFPDVLSTSFEFISTVPSTHVARLNLNAPSMNTTSDA